MPFRAEYAPLAEQHPAWGSVAILPWDTDIFGFPVAELRLDAAEQDRIDPHDLAEHLVQWAASKHVELVSVRLAAPNPLMESVLAEADFRAVESSLLAVLPRLRLDKMPPSRVDVRVVEPEDYNVVARIAECAFEFGRYHTDAFFPRPLANRRYRWWVEHALREPSPGTRLFVLGPSGEPCGFFHVEVTESIADLRLGAVHPEAIPGAGYHLYLGVLTALGQAGVRRVQARIAAANTSVLNLYAALGFTFREPEIVFHWHARRPGLLAQAREPHAVDVLAGRG